VAQFDQRRVVGRAVERLQRGEVPEAGEHDAARIGRTLQTFGLATAHQKGAAEAGDHVGYLDRVALVGLGILDRDTGEQESAEPGRRRRTLEALDDEDARCRCALPDGDKRRVIGIVGEGARRGIVGKFEDYDARAGPFALQRNALAAAHDIGSAMACDQRRYLRLVGPVTFGIVDIHRRDKICGHRLVPP
jgi:hypothetical protein